jgi:hypothetical protein
VTDAEHAAFRRAMKKYSLEQGEIECEQCAKSHVSVSLVSPHKERAFYEVEAAGYDTAFDDEYDQAVFYEDTQKALIAKLFELGDAACLCRGCGGFLMKLHRQERI